MKKIAVFGSREWPRLQDVALKVNELFEKHGEFILVSGGATGASTVAEQTGMEFGMPVISFRPVQLAPVGFDPQYGVDEWRLYRGSGKIVNHYDPTWADWSSAAGFRSMLMAERADFGYAFWDGHSAGTGHEIGLFETANKSLEVIGL